MSWRRRVRGRASDSGPKRHSPTSASQLPSPRPAPRRTMSSCTAAPASSRPTPWPRTASGCRR
eukprot:1982653-Pyramimonas_sp.AAC.1